MRSLLLILLFVFCRSVFAQPNSIWFDKVTDEGGHSVHGASHILQDKDGYIWICHSDGITKFDGYNYQLYSRDKLVSTFGNTKSVALVFQDKRQDVWIVTDVGTLMKYQADLDRFQLMNDTTTAIEGRAHSFTEDQEGNFWIGSAGGGLYKINVEKGWFTNYRHKKSDSTTVNNDFVTSVVIDRGGKLWVGTTNGLCSYNSKADAFHRYPLANSNPNDTYRYRVIRDMNLSVDGHLYAGSYGGLHKINIKTGQSRHYIHDPSSKKSLSHNSIFSLQQDADGLIWIATYGGGLNRFDPSTQEFTSWKASPNEHGKLQTNNLFTLYIDRQDRLWIGAADGGISLYSPHAKKIYSVGSRPYNSSTISAGWIRTIFQENDSIIWIGFNGAGVNKYNLKSGKVEARYVQDPRDATSLAHNAVVAIDRDSYGNLWFGLEGGGLNKLNARSGKFTRHVFRENKNSISNNAVSALVVDDDLIWITTYVGGLDVFDIRSTRFYHFSEDSLKALGISFATTEDIIRHDGNIWFATHQGVVVFDKSHRKFVKIAHTKGDITTVARTQQLELRPYLDKEVLINNDNSEVIKIEYKGPNDFEQEILWKDTIDHGESYEMRFAADRFGNLWISSIDELSRIDLRKNDKSTFTIGNELSVERRLTGIFTASDGRIFLTGSHGFSWFYPDQIKKDTTSVKIALTALEIFNKPVLIGRPDTASGDEFYIPKQIDRLETLELQYRQNFFSIRFSALTFSQRDKVQYAYQLEGFDRDWVYVRNRRFASYTNLDPGTYKFKVKAKNTDGFWTLEPKTINIVILPPFWRTSWFIAAAIITASVLIYSLHQYRVAQSLRVERLRNKIASDLHDEVGSSLTRISIYSDLLQNGVGTETRKDYLDGIGALSREVVSTMGDIVWSIDNRNDSFGALIIRMKDFATELLQARNIELEFTMVGIDERKVLDPALKQNIYLIFKESIHNIVKHSDAGKVSVTISNVGLEFTLTISDDGAGLHGEIMSKGNGMRNMRRRAEAVEANFEVLNQQGTTIRLFRKSI